MAQPMHVQQLLKLKQQAVQQQKAIQPQATPGPAAVQQKVLGSCGSTRPSCLYVKLGPAPGHGAHGGQGGPASLPGTHTQEAPGLELCQSSGGGLAGWAALLTELVESSEGGRLRGYTWGGARGSGGGRCST